MNDHHPLGPLSLVLAGLALLGSGCEALPQPSARPGSAPGSAPGVELPERGFDVEHYAIDLSLKPLQRAIDGTCRVQIVSTVDGLGEVELDLVGLGVESVADAAGRPLDFSRPQGSLIVELPEPLRRGESAELAVRYGGRPVTGLWFSGAGPEGGAPTQVFTQGQAEHSRGWFPCVDHPADRASSEVRVRMPGDWVAVAPGERIDLVEDGATRTEHWRMDFPHPPYLVSLVAGELVVEESEWEGVPLLFLAEPQYADWLEASFHETDEILAFLSDYTGLRYPYPKYSQAAVENFPWGGMENISATTLTPLTLDDERGNRDQQSTGLVAHEAAHQWFGNLFTCRDWSHVWLNEGFATYMALLYLEETRGVDEMRARMRNAQEQYLEQDRGAARRPTVWPVWKDPEDLFDTRAYQGAAARLHLLRFIVGDELFRAAVRDYVRDNAGRSVVTADLQLAFEEASGQDLDTFFEQWIYGRGYPEFRLAWDWDPHAREVDLSVRQMQASGDGTPAEFDLPVLVEVHDEGGTTLHRVRVDERKEEFTFPVSGRPLYVRFDKYGWIPGRVEWERSASEWLAIAGSDDDVNGRRDAVRALGELAAESVVARRPQEHETIVAALSERLTRDTSSWVRADAAQALGRAGGLEARERLITAAEQDPEARVRVAALEALTAFAPSKELASFGQRVFEQAYSWGTMGAAAKLVAAADPPLARHWISDQLVRESPHDQLRGFLFEALGTLEARDVDSELRRWAGDASVHPAARVAAVKALAGRTRERVANSRFIASLLDAQNFRLRAAAVQALAKLDDENARRALSAYYPVARTAGERRAIEASLSGQRLP